MSLRFGSGWLVIYFLICSCTFKCSAPQLRARDYTTFNPFEPLPFSVTPDTRFRVTFSPLQGRAALTVEVTRPRGRPASRCCVGAFQNSQRLEMCERREAGKPGLADRGNGKTTFWSDGWQPLVRPVKLLKMIVWRGGTRSDRASHRT